MFMPKIIKENKIIDDNWQLVREESELNSGKLIVALPLWLAHKESLQTRQGDIGLLLTSSDEPESIKDDLHYFSLIAVEFHENSSFLASGGVPSGRHRALGRRFLRLLLHLGFAAASLSQRPRGPLAGHDQ